MRFPPFARFIPSSLYFLLCASVSPWLVTFRFLVGR